MKVLTLLAMTIVLVPVGCGSNETEAGTGVDLEGSSWVLRSAEVDGAEVPASTQTEATLTFGADGAATGSTGCNRFNATWGQDGDALSIQLSAVTQAACRSPELALQEQSVLALLPRTASAEGREAELRLLDADGATLLAYTAGLAGLADTSWAATGINNQTGGVESTALTSTVTAIFAAAGGLSGSTGCRDYTAAWQTDADSISITDVALLGEECAGEEATLEASYVAALESSTILQLEGSSLNLRDSGGATQVNYSLTTS